MLVALRLLLACAVVAARTGRVRCAAGRAVQELHARGAREVGRRDAARRRAARRSPGRDDRGERWWAKAALARGWAQLALQCPREQKCDDSFWKWDGEPQWVFDQVAAVAAQAAIDPARVYLVGWSGGASWIGWRAQAWTAVFAAVVLHGGGIAPRDEGCPARTLPAYFLVGDKNPLHRHAIELRDALDACKADVTWDLIKGAEHDGEADALTRKKADAILDWLGQPRMRARRPRHSFARHATARGRGVERDRESVAKVLRVRDDHEHDAARRDEHVRRLRERALRKPRLPVHVARAIREHRAVQRELGARCRREDLRDRDRAGGGSRMGPRHARRAPRR